MTKLLISKFQQFNTNTGTRGTIFLLLVGLFVISLMSDIVYGSVTAASSFIKLLLVIGLGVSFSSLLTINKQHTSKLVSKNTKRNKKPLVRTQEAQIKKQEIASVNSEDEDKNVEQEQAEMMVRTVDTVLPIIRDELVNHQNPERAQKQREFFATKENEKRKNRTYLGVNISDIVKISETYANAITIGEVEELMTSDGNDERIIAIWLLINKYKVSGESTKQEIYDFYIKNRSLVDNWDMVDLAARNIIGAHLQNNPAEKSISDTLITSDVVWDQRTAVMSAHPLTLQGDLGYGFSVAEKLIDSQEELVQSAIGWVLKESYKQDAQETEGFIRSHFHSLSKQAIRIGTERMDKEYRKLFLRGEFEPAKV